jgi:hypothetical protein
VPGGWDISISQSSIYGTWWRGPFAPKFLRIQMPGSCGRLSRRHGSTFLQRSSVHLWKRCHVELLHFAGLEGVLHDTRYLSHDFWHFSVLNSLCMFMPSIMQHSLVCHFHSHNTQNVSAYKAPHAVRESRRKITNHQGTNDRLRKTRASYFSKLL